MLLWLCKTILIKSYLYFLVIVFISIIHWRSHGYRLLKTINISNSNSFKLFVKNFKSWLLGIVSIDFLLNDKFWGISFLIFVLMHCYLRCFFIIEVCFKECYKICLIKWDNLLLKYIIMLLSCTGNEWLN